MTLCFHCSDGMCSPDTHLGIHLTLWPETNGYVTGYNSTCTVFILQLFVCTAHGISFFSALPLASVVIIWYLVFPFILVRAYLTFLKAVIIILKHATSLRLSMSPRSALNQADLGYQRADVDKKIQQHVVASQGHSAELDGAFFIAIEMVCQFLCLFKHTKLLFPTSGVINVCA